MAIKTFTTMQTDTQMWMRDTTSITAAQLKSLINTALREMYELNQDWTVRLNPTQVGLNATQASQISTSGTYGDRIASIHGLYVESSATNVTSKSQLERMSAAELRIYSVSGLDGSGTPATATPSYYSAEPLAADTDATAANHGLWRISFEIGATVAAHYSLKVRLRYTDLVGNTDVPDCPDSWCDSASILAASRGAGLLGNYDLSQWLAGQLPDWLQPIVQRANRGARNPRPNADDQVAR